MPSSPCAKSIMVARTNSIDDKAIPVANTTATSNNSSHLFRSQSVFRKVQKSFLKILWSHTFVNIITPTLFSGFSDSSLYMCTYHSQIPCSTGQAHLQRQPYRDNGIESAEMRRTFVRSQTLHSYPDKRPPAEQ